MSDFTVRIDSMLDLSKARGELNKFINKKYKVQLAVDNTSFSQLQKSTKSFKFKPTADTSGIKKASAEIQKLRNSSSSIKVRTSVDTSGINKANVEFQRLKNLAGQISRIRLKIAGLDATQNTSEIKSLTSQLQQLQQLYNTGFLKGGFNASQLNQLSNIFGNTNLKIAETQAKMKDLANSTTVVKKSFSQLDATTASNKTLTWLKNNTRAAKDYGDVLKDLANKQRLATSNNELAGYTKQVKAITAEAAALGKTGKSFREEFARSFKAIGQFAYTYGAIQTFANQIRSAVTELKNIDSIITEISKTSDLTTSQLKELASTAFDSASEYGKTASDYLTGVQEMSRSGFYGDHAAELAKLSILAQAAGDMTADVSNSYLLATNAAYEYAGSVDALNEALDGQNIITNRHSVSMNDMAEATTQAASMASQSGVEIDELSALIGTAVARTKKSGSEVGTALKALFINLQNTQNDKIVGTFDSLGISMTKMVGDTKLLKTPIELLRELSDVYNSLPEGSELRANVLTNIGGKHHANILASLLGGIDVGEFDTMLQDYSEGMGSAAAEAEKSANNWEGSLNKLSNAWTALIQNFANSEGITGAINTLTSITKGVDSVASLPSLMGLIGGAWTTKNGLGKCKISNVIVYNALSYKIA